MASSSNPSLSNWQYPPPRRGLAGQWDRFVGPGMTRAELLLILGVSLGAAALMALYAVLGGLGWNAAQVILSAIIALDLAGGVATNATSTAKRWYHREGQGAAQHFGFVALHVIHPLLLMALFRPGDWAFVAVVYGYLLLAAAIILRVPLYLQRPLALTLLVGGILVNAYAVVPTAGLEWFVPVLYLKLLVSHLLREEPYRAGAT